ncbi:MAG: hypothetical protein ACFFD4_02250 [Candidatus Odinarchaeota archaeon]
MVWRQELPKGRESKRIHFAVSSTSWRNPDHGPYCGRRGAVYFTDDWEKVTCGWCKRAKKEQEEWEKRRAEERREDELREQQELERLETWISRNNFVHFRFLGEALDDFYRRARWARDDQYRTARKWLEEQEEREKLDRRYRELTFDDLLHPDLSLKDDTFPRDFHESHYYYLDDEYSWDVPPIALSKEKYIELLEQLKEAIERQLQRLKGKTDS